MVEITPHLHKLPTRDAAISYILAVGDTGRAKALDIDNPRVGVISDIAENFRVSAQSYEPIGSVERLDVFVADPPAYAAHDRRDWRENKLGKWVDFSRSEVVFHECPGIHANMLNTEHVADFARILKSPMRRRGV